MSEEVIGLKTALTLGGALVTAVSAFWAAKLTAKKDNDELDEKIAEIRAQLAMLAGKSQGREDVKEVVKDSLEGLIMLLKEIRRTVDSNNTDIKDVLIKQGILTERVSHLERRRD
jgi:hypothetical protein